MNIIEEYGKRIHEELGLEKDFDIYKLVEGLGGRVKEEDGLSMAINSRIKKVRYKKRDKIKFVIEVRKDMSEEEKRYYIAHEIGHIIIHYRYLEKEEWKKKCIEYKYKSKENIEIGIKEIEANTFAEAILMPYDKFKEEVRRNYIEEEGIYNIENIAREFKVSKERVYNRGIHLGIWK